MSITKENPVRSAGDYPCELTKALENEGESTKNAGVREPLSLISSSNVNVGYSAQTIAEQKVVKTESTSRETVYGTCTTPKTPRRTAEVNPGTPLTPMANLKVLIAAASSAFEKECGRSSEAKKPCRIVDKMKAEGNTEDSGGRKMKSLAVLCQKFLSVAESNIGVGNDFSLEMMSQSLDTNRRRIYDIINVLEALEMIVKQSKNWYTWLGSDNMLVTLAKMRAMAQDDPEFRSLMAKENTSAFTPTMTSSSSGESMKTPQDEDADDKQHTPGDETVMMGGSNGRWDKSLGVLCQKFVMLFLVTPDHEVTLEYAGNVLMPDSVECYDGNVFVQPVTNPKTKVRRLYDIANVLTTLGLIKKKTFLAPNHRKMPGYSWAGPSIAEIQTIPVFRKSEYNLYPFYSKKKSVGGKGGVPLSRKPSLGSVRPFLHQYEVKIPGSEGQSNSAPSTPVKSQGGFKRSLSFGAGPSRGSSGSRPSVPVPIAPAPPPQAPAASKSVVARPLCPKQLNYLHEVQEFEAEVQKHSHKYPHVASVFHEFIRKYQSTLEQVAASGRSILPKPSTPPNVPTSIKPPFSPGELARSLLGLNSVASSDSTMTNLIMNAAVSAMSQVGPQPTMNTSNVAKDSVVLPQATASSQNSGHIATAMVWRSTPDSQAKRSVENFSNATAKTTSAPQEHTKETPSSTHGTLMSPGGKSQTFMSVEEVMVPTDNLDKRPPDDSTSKQPSVQVHVPPPVSMTLGASGTPVVQQAMQMLGSLVNQKPILASTAFQSVSNSSQLKVTPKPPINISAPSLIAASIPRVVHSQPQTFNPAALLTDPASQLVQCALSPNLYYQSIAPAYPVTTSLFGVPPLYQTIPTPGTTRSMASLGKKPDSVDRSEISPPKRPRLE